MHTLFKSLFLLVPVAIGLARPAHAQTVLFQEQFDTPARWSTATRSPANVARYKGTDWLQYPPLGNITPNSFNLLYTEWGNAPVQMAGDGAEGNYLRMKLSTYNPNNFKATAARKYLFGTELQTLQKFGPPAPGHAIEFESRLRVPVMAPRMIASFYTYSQKLSAGTVFSDEVDFEYLGADLGNQVQLVSWNDWGRRNDTDVTPGRSYNDGVHHRAITTGDPGTASNPVNRAQWHQLKIRWICVSNGVFRTEFYSKQNSGDPYVLLFTENDVQTNEGMEMHLNIWATNPTPAPTSAPGTNYLMDVDWCRVSDVLVSALRKPKTVPSNGRS
ncbi:hypothetical protein IAD21_05120 [Abditibacteriota bacterium]|nr:hypothetical protein IAD21_05120 [Abditibacteriota bacterium]